MNNLPAVQETQEMRVQSLVEESMAAYSSILAGRISWTEKPGGLQFTGSRRVRHN